MEKRSLLKTLIQSNYNFHIIDPDGCEYYVYLDIEKTDEYFYILSIDTDVHELSNILAERVKFGVDSEDNPSLQWWSFHDKKWDTYMNGAEFDWFYEKYNSYLFDKEVEEVLNEQRQRTYTTKTSTESNQQASYPC